VTVSDSYACVICTNQSRSYTVFGRVPALQWSSPGFYSDTIVATVTFN
jgi:spore coat protein U-like protein